MDDMIAAVPTSVPDSVKAEFNALQAKLYAEWAGFRTILPKKNAWHIDWNVITKAFQFIMVNVLEYAQIVDAETGLVNEDKKATVLAYLMTLADLLIRPEVPVFLLPFYSPAMQWIMSMISAEIEVIVAELHKKPPTPIPV